MEKYILSRHLKAFGEPVISFPFGIAETFEKLMKMTGAGYERSFFGISYMNAAGEIEYHAAVLETGEDEAEKYNCNRYIIERGEYLTETIWHWRDKTGSIKDVFNSLLKNGCPLKHAPAIEWYKNDEEMVCMLKG
jgi:hypothetical protein